jgi:tRNA nucleotidyltransferase (CCA-adding enzyme)
LICVNVLLCRFCQYAYKGNNINYLAEITAAFQRGWAEIAGMGWVFVEKIHSDQGWQGPIDGKIARVTTEAGNGMPDYIYLLENRLSADQKNALRNMREAAREAGTILFLTGDAVRDLTSGHAVRDLEVTVHGSALKLKKTIETLGGTVWGEDEVSRALYLCFPGTVRVDAISAHRVEYPKPGKPIFHPASIQEDLRRRDFTVNAMAISLNEGSFGLLMDPLNGAADIEARTLRLVSNYGFIEEPSLLIRATRYRARLGWELDPKTKTRYENAKGENVIEFLSAQARSKELEQIGHEAEGLKVLRALEDEGWMKVLFPAWTHAKADEEKLNALHDLAVELLLQGVHADMSAAQMQLLTAKLAPKELAALKKLMLRPGFLEEWNSLDAMAAGFAKVLLAEENSTPSASYKLFTSYDPEAILWLGFTSIDPAVKERFNLFLKVWPEVRQRIPHAMMQEMRITPELAAYGEIVRDIFLELIDGRLTAAEEIRAFLEPHSPPAPPPRETIKKPRAKRGEARLKEASYDDDEEAEAGLDEDEVLDDIVVDDEELDLGLSLPKVELDAEIDDDLLDEEPEKAESEPIAPKHFSKPSSRLKPVTEISYFAKADVQVKQEAAAAAEFAAKPIPVEAVETLKPEIVAALAVAEPEEAKKPELAIKAKLKPAPVAESSVSAVKPAPALPKTKPVSAPVVPVSAPVQKQVAVLPAAKAGKAAKPAVTAMPSATKAADKVAAKAPVKVPAKPVVAKPPVKVAAKAATAKSAATKGKPVPAVSHKAAKPAKPSKPAEKKTAPKPGKKR